MSTATTTTITKAAMPEHGLLPLKAGIDPLPNSSSSAEVMLQSLYHRAAQAFLYRDIVLTATLIASAFAILQPPVEPAPDPFDSHRRKWDILRITLESMVYSSPPDRTALPATMRELLLLSPLSFVTTSHARSLALFTPSSLPRTPTSAFLPYQVLITHIASSIKVNCTAVGREFTESWLSNRGQYDFIPSTGEAYEKVLELYCLHVLPRLEEWDYAKEFLAYEVELLPSKRTEFQKSLETIRARAQAEKASQTSVALSRTPSPSRWINSHQKPPGRMTEPPEGSTFGEERQRSGSSTSVSSDVTVTRQNSRDPRPLSRVHPPPSTVRGTPNSVVMRTGPSLGILASIKESLYTYFSTNRLATLTVLFLLLPVVAFIIRLRRTRTTRAPASTADQVKRRLFDIGAGSVLHKLWSEVGRAVRDTVRMGGGGLV